MRSMTICCNLRNRSFHRYGFHVLIISAPRQLEIGLPGKLHEGRDRFFPPGEINALSLDRSPQKTPHQFAVPRQPFVCGHDAGLNIFYMVGHPRAKTGNPASWARKLDGGLSGAASTVAVFKAVKRVAVGPIGRNVTSRSSCKPNFGSSSLIQPYSRLPTVEPPIFLPRSSATDLIPGCAKSAE